MHKFSCSVSLISLLPFCKFQLHKVKNMSSAIKANELGQKKNYNLFAIGRPGANKVKKAYGRWLSLGCNIT